MLDFIDPELGQAIDGRKAGPDPVTSAPLAIDGGDREHYEPPAVSDLPPLPDRDSGRPSRWQPPAPVPVIGSIPVAGQIIDAGTFRNATAAGDTLNVGAQLGGRPGVLGIVFHSTGAAGSVSLVPNAGGLNEGFVLPSNVAVFFPITRATLRFGAGAPVVSWAILAADVTA